MIWDVLVTLFWIFVYSRLELSAAERGGEPGSWVSRRVFGQTYSFPARQARAKLVILGSVSVSVILIPNEITWSFTDFFGHSLFCGQLQSTACAWGGRLFLLLKQSWICSKHANKKSCSRLHQNQPWVMWKNWQPSVPTTNESLTKSKRYWPITKRFVRSIPSHQTPDTKRLRARGALFFYLVMPVQHTHLFPYSPPPWCPDQ